MEARPQLIYKEEEREGEKYGYCEPAPRPLTTSASAKFLINQLLHKSSPKHHLQVFIRLNFNKTFQVSNLLLPFHPFIHLPHQSMKYPGHNQCTPYPYPLLHVQLPLSATRARARARPCTVCRETYALAMHLRAAFLSRSKNKSMSAPERLGAVRYSLKNL